MTGDLYFVLSETGPLTCITSPEVDCGVGHFNRILNSFTIPKTNYQLNSLGFESADEIIRVAYAK